MSQADARMYYMHCPMTSQGDACTYCMGSVVLISSRIYLTPATLHKARYLFIYTQRNGLMLTLF